MTEETSEDKFKNGKQTRCIETVKLEADPGKEKYVSDILIRSNECQATPVILKSVRRLWTGNMH